MRIDNLNLADAQKLLQSSIGFVQSDRIDRVQFNVRQKRQATLLKLSRVGRMGSSEDVDAMSRAFKQLRSNCGIGGIRIPPVHVAPYQNIQGSL